MVATFGTPDSVHRLGEEGKEEDDGNSSGALNLFPEPEVDEVRAQRDAALAVFVQARERRELLAKKMGLGENEAVAAKNADYGSEDLATERKPKRGSIRK